MKVLVYVFFILIFYNLQTNVKGSDRYIENTGPHEGKQIKCAGRRMEHNKIMRDVKCTPRKSLVKLRPEIGFMYFPHMVWVNRCNGLCGINLSCMPVESIKKSFIIRRNHIVSKQQSCSLIQVEEHTKCKCKCDVMKYHCNRHQVYLPNDCACICINRKEKFQCLMLKGMIWNNEKCRCECEKAEEECSSGLQWIPSICRCAKVMSEIETNELKF